MADDSGWKIVTLEEKTAKQYGMPVKIPVPVPVQSSEKLGDMGLGHDRVQGWVKTFLDQAGAGWRRANNDEAKSYDAYLAKMGPWKKAQGAFERGDFAAAASALNLVIKVDPNDYSARQSLATVHAAAGRTQEALEVFDAIAEVWEGSPDFHLGYANTLILGERRDEAIGQFVLALEAKPDCREAMEGLTRLGVLVKLYENPLDSGSLIFVRSDSVLEHMQSLWGAEERDMAYFLQQAGYHEEERRYEVMLAAAEKALEVGGETQAQGVLAKARALRLLGRVEEARSCLAALEGSAGACVELALCAGEDEAAANEQIDRALELDPGHLAALTIRFLPKDPSDLETLGANLPALEKFVEEHPVGGALRILARAQSQAGMEEKCLESFEKAVELLPEDEELRAEYWSELGKQGRFEKVIEQAEALGDMKNRDWRLRWTEAEAMNGLGRRSEAHGAFMALNADESLHVAVRARAKRAVESLRSAPQVG